MDEIGNMRKQKQTFCHIKYNDENNQASKRQKQMIYKLEKDGFEVESHLNQEFDTTLQLHKNVLENMTFSNSNWWHSQHRRWQLQWQKRGDQFLNSQSWSPKEEESRKIPYEIVLHCSKNSFGFLHPVIEWLPQWSR